VAAVDFDLRTRTIDDVVDVDPATFHRDTVQSMIVEHGEFATRAFIASGLRSFVVAVDGDAYTWRLGSNGRLVVEPGDIGTDARVDLDAEWFSDLVNDVRSTVALMIADEPVMGRGHIFHAIAWEPVLRALLDGRPAYEPGAVDLVDRDGAPLDLDRSFDLSDDQAAMSHFLAQAGFLHVRNVFTATEMADLSDEMDEWLARMTPDDPRAWFATVDGEQTCVRVTNLGRDSLAFPHEARLAPIAGLTQGPHRYRGSDVLLKPVGVEAGISDLPWHKDCALGLHSYRCMSVTCGVAVTASGPDNGQLGVVAGSHRLNMSLFDLDESIDLPQQFLATEPGDVTVHLSCALHCATPPRHSERRVTYSGFALPGSDKALDDKIRAVRDQAGRDTYAPT